MALEGMILGVTVSITLEQAAQGVEKEINTRHQECSKCDGSGSSESRQKRCAIHAVALVKLSIKGLGIRKRAQAYWSGITIENPCTVCTGQGQFKGSDSVKVKIPAGINDSSRYVLEVVVMPVHKRSIW